MKSVFISSPFFSDNQIFKVKQVEQALEKNKTIGDVYSPRLSQDVKDTTGTNAWGKEIRDKDLNALKGSDVIVAILDMDEKAADTNIPTDSDSGTSYEIGFGHAIGKPVFTVRFDKHATNLMLSATSQAYFSNMNNLSHYDFNKMRPIEFKGVLR